MNELLTVGEVAKILKLSPYTIRERARTGIIPARKIGRQWRFKKEEVMDWFNSQGKEGKE